MNHGYFDDAIAQLRDGDSPAERAGAARKLGVACDPEAVSHLVTALSDGAPEVRRASTEALGQIGDASALAPLNELLLTETSRQLPQAVIRHAINSISITQGKVMDKPAPPPAAVVASSSNATPQSHFIEHRRSREATASGRGSVAACC